MRVSPNMVKEILPEKARLPIPDLIANPETSAKYLQLRVAAVA
jgi:hypothetical protein